MTRTPSWLLTIAFAAMALFGAAVVRLPAQQTPDEFRKLQADLKKLIDDNAKLAAQVKAQPKQIDPPKDAPAFPRGARLTPVPKLMAALEAGNIKAHRIAKATPAQVAMVPPRLSMWGNSQYGDCVSAESAFAVAAFSVYSNVPEAFITETTVISWAKTHGFLNGADLLEVIQAMQKYGMVDEKGVLRKEGNPSTVDYTSEANLQNAISVGPVSIAIDADALPSGAGNKSGWYAFGGRSFNNTDHCVSLPGYGSTAFLAQSLGIPVPPGAPATSYLLFTWNTIGLVDHKWILGTCREAWLRTPTVVGIQPVPPDPKPPTPPTPEPPIPVPPGPNPPPYPSVTIEKPGIYLIVPAADWKAVNDKARLLDQFREMLAPSKTSLLEPPVDNRQQPRIVSVKNALEE